MSGAGSYLALPALTNTHHELRLDVEFKPLAPEGLLLFSGGRSGPVEDFVSLAMVGGHLEFRYELGSGKYLAPGAASLWARALRLCGSQAPGGAKERIQEPSPAPLPAGSSVGSPGGQQFPCRGGPGLWPQLRLASPQGWLSCGAPSRWRWAAGTACPRSASTRTAACA